MYYMCYTPFFIVNFRFLTLIVVHVELFLLEQDYGRSPVRLGGSEHFTAVRHDNRRRGPPVLD